MIDFAGLDLRPEEPPDDVVVDRQAILREDRIAELLEFLQDFVVHAGVVVVRAAEQHHAQAIFAFQIGQHFAGRAAHGDVIEMVERAIALFDGAQVFLRRQAEDVLELPRTSAARRDRAATD